MMLVTEVTESKLNLVYFMGFAAGIVHLIDAILAFCFMQSYLIFISLPMRIVLYRVEII